MRKLLIVGLLFLSACAPSVPKVVVQPGEISTGIKQIIVGDFEYGIFSFQDNGNTCYVVRTFESSSIDCIGGNDE